MLAGSIPSETFALGLQMTIFSLCPYQVDPPSVCIGPNFLFLKRHQSDRIMTSLTLIDSLNTSIRIQSPSEVLRVRTSAFGFGGDISASNVI